MSPRCVALTAALLGGTSVLLGAFGAHALESVVRDGEADAAEQARRLDNWEVAARYQMYHALALFCLAGAQQLAERRAARAAAWLWTIGVLIFSGCLYAYTLSGVRILGAIVPLGGTSLILGWVFLAAAVLRERPQR